MRYKELIREPWRKPGIHLPMCETIHSAMCAKPEKTWWTFEDLQKSRICSRSYASKCMWWLWAAGVVEVRACSWSRGWYSGWEFRLS